MMQAPRRRPLGSRRPFVALVAGLLAAAPAAANREPLSLEEIEIQGERLVPQAVYIVGGAEADSLAAATVSDYLALLDPAADRVPLVIILEKTP